MHLRTFLNKFLLAGCCFTISAIGIGCINNENDEDNSVTYADTELPFFTIVGVDIKAEKEAEVNTWYNDSYLPVMTNYPGLKKAIRYKKTVGGFGVDSMVQYWTIYGFSSKADLDGLQLSQPYTTANTDMATKWPNGEITFKWTASFEKIKSWVEPGADNPASIFTAVAGVIKAENEPEVTKWYNEVHVPWLMKCEGIVKATRLKKISGAGTNDTEFPTYLATYNYADQASYDNFAKDQNFIDAEAERAQHWKNKEFEIPWVFSAENIKNIIK